MAQASTATRRVEYRIQSKVDGLGTQLQDGSAGRLLLEDGMLPAFTIPIAPGAAVKHGTITFHTSPKKIAALIDILQTALEIIDEHGTEPSKEIDGDA